MLLFICITGLYFPITTLIISYLLVGARILYIVMYIKKGADARRLGAITGQLPINLLALITFVYAIVEACKQTDQINTVF